MPRLAKKWGQWSVHAGDLQAGACLFRRRHGGSSLLCPVRVLGREIIHKNHDSVNKKLTFSDRWLMLALGSFDSGDIDSEMVRKHRAIAAIEPIKSDTGFVADSLGSFDGYWSSSGFILAISVLFQICAPREFSLINSESLAGMA